MTSPSTVYFWTFEFANLYQFDSKLARDPLSVRPTFPYVSVASTPEFLNKYHVMEIHYVTDQVIIRAILMFT